MNSFDEIQIEEDAAYYEWYWRNELPKLAESIISEVSAGMVERVESQPVEDDFFPF